MSIANQAKTASRCFVIAAVVLLARILLLTFGQVGQREAPSVGEYEPAGQSEQTARPAVWANLPKVQSGQLSRRVMPMK